jgi:hypothetical protein
VLQVEYFLLAVEAPFVSSHAFSLVPNLHVGRMHLGLHRQANGNCSARPQSRGG